MPLPDNTLFENITCVLISSIVGLDWIEKSMSEKSALLNLENITATQGLQKNGSVEKKSRGSTSKIAAVKKKDMSMSMIVSENGGIDNFDKIPVNGDDLDDHANGMTTIHPNVIPTQNNARTMMQTGMSTFLVNRKLENRVSDFNLFSYKDTERPVPSLKPSSANPRDLTSTNVAKKIRNPPKQTKIPEAQLISIDIESSEKNSQSKFDSGMETSFPSSLRTVETSRISSPPYISSWPEEVQNSTKFGKENIIYPKSMQHSSQSHFSSPAVIASFFDNDVNEFNLHSDSWSTLQLSPSTKPNTTKKLRVIPAHISEVHRVETAEEELSKVKSWHERIQNSPEFEKETIIPSQHSSQNHLSSSVIGKKSSFFDNDFIDPNQHTDSWSEMQQFPSIKTSGSSGSNKLRDIPAPISEVHRVETAEEEKSKAIPQPLSNDMFPRNREASTTSRRSNNQVCSSPHSPCAPVVHVVGGDRKRPRLAAPSFVGDKSSIQSKRDQLFEAGFF